MAGMSTFITLLVFATGALLIGKGILGDLAKDSLGSETPLVNVGISNIHHNRGLNSTPSYEEQPPSARALRSAGRRLTFENNEANLLNTEALDGSQEGSEGRHVLLVIAIPSVRRDRRHAIRETWSKWADEQVVLRFFTEFPKEENREEMAAISEESRVYGDLIIQGIDRGMNFGVKLLWAMRWMHDHYSFDFFLRLDDDYFLCLERLVDELNCLRTPGKVENPFYAGYRACRVEKNAYYIDESYILISSVLIDRVLATSESDLKCSGYGSLTAGAWFTTGGPGNPTGDAIMVDDYRLDRWGSRWKKSRMAAGNRFRNGRVCDESIIGIHRTYSRNMYVLWTEVSDGPNNMSHPRDKGCEEDPFRYEDDGKCPFAGRGVGDKVLERDNVQPCDSFSPPRSEKYCGREGC